MKTLAGWVAMIVVSLLSGYACANGDAIIVGICVGSSFLIGRYMQ